MDGQSSFSSLWDILVCCVNGFQGFTGNLLGHSDLETQYVIFEEPSKKSSEDVNKSCSMFRESLKPNLILSSGVWFLV